MRLPIWLLYDVKSPDMISAQVHSSMVQGYKLTARLCPLLVYIIRRVRDKPRQPFRSSRASFCVQGKHPIWISTLKYEHQLFLDVLDPNKILTWLIGSFTHRKMYNDSRYVMPDSLMHSDAIFSCVKSFEFWLLFFIFVFMLFTFPYRRIFFLFDYVHVLTVLKTVKLSDGVTWLSGTYCLRIYVNPHQSIVSSPN